MRIPRYLGVALVATALVAQQPPPVYEPAQPGDGQPQDAYAGPPDEPGRQVGRLSVLNGDASIRRGDADWVAAALNAPLLGGDAISVAPGGTAEIQFDSSNFARFAGDSEARLADLENGRYQIQLAKGLVTWRTLRHGNATPEISTGLVAVRPLGLAAARVEVAPDGTTRVIVRHGEVEVSTQRGTERVREGSMMVVRGTTEDPEFQIVNAPARDQWDNWSDQRDDYLQRAQSPRYVSPDIYGTEDLDRYGRWNYDPQYGNVWVPTVAADWAPYRNGQWVWEDYYGWTWVDYSPWGWAPFHYGSWYWRTGFGWSWFPGRPYEHFWWRPALVGFVGFGGGWGGGFGFGNVGWIPLAPYERFCPWYGRGVWGGGWGDGWRGRAPLNNINIINNVNINNNYRNARVGNGITAVSGADFQRGNFRNHFTPMTGQLQQASLVRGSLPVTPSAAHLNFSGRTLGNTGGNAGPRTDFGNQRFFSRMPANSGGPQRTPFAQQQAAVRSSVEGRGFGRPSSGGFAGQSSPSRPDSFAPRSNPSPGWQRFGNPQGFGGRQFESRGSERPSSSGFAGQASPSQPAWSSPAVPSAPRGNPGSQRFGNPQGFEGRQFGGNPAPQYRMAPSAPAPSYERPAAPSWGGQGRQFGGPSRSIEVAPPIVRQRQQAPSYNAPAPNRFQGGGGFGSPGYRSAPSAPAPSWRGGGGAGGGRPGGGGGGHAGNRR